MKKRRIVSAPKDFDALLLPQNRKDQFFNLLKNQNFTLFRIGLLLLVFLIPFLAIDVIRNLFDSGFYNQFVNKVITEQEYNFYLFVDLMVQTGIEVLLTPLLSVALAGINGVYREMVEGENILFFTDFKLSLKDNYKSTLLKVFVFFLIFTVLRFVTNYFIGAFFITIPCYTFFVLIIIPLTIITIVFSIYYQGNFFNVLSNSIKLYPTYWWKYLLISVFFFGVIYGINIGFDGNIIPYIKTITLAALIIVILPILLLLIHSISISMFDKYVNQEYYPDNFKKGLYDVKK